MVQMSALSWIKDVGLSVWANARGWRTERKIVVFDSDDWGASHIKDPETRRRLAKRGIDLDQSSYHRLDTLESRRVLEALFEILGTFRD